MAHEDQRWSGRESGEYEPAGRRGDWSKSAEGACDDDPECDGGFDEGRIVVDDLDLDASVADSITVVEWGQGIAEGLAEDRLEVDIWTSAADIAVPKTI